MSKNSNPMKVVTGVNTRWSYVNAWEPKSINGGTPKFSVSLIIPKSDTKTVAKIKAAIEAAYKEGEAKLKGNSRTVPALSAIKTPLRDGDAERPDDPAYGNVAEQSLLDCWNRQDYREFRHRVNTFYFPFCTCCWGCEDREENLHDCFLGEAPTCGGCLWSTGQVFCP